ncbi:hypothetical protein SCUCBS95973_009253 [Sporothrix curviconia]|uniref:EGF domain-specific O-linked N-acetylglucosamine transferase n=1 Tax=Sporothrix curviconia TaxID=1260050 RepID=A0ABP0CTD7_9PEZI
MLLRGCSLPAAFRRWAVSVPLALLTTLAVYALWGPTAAPCCSGMLPSWAPIGPSPSSKSSDDLLSIPELSGPPILPVSEHAAFCDKRFTAAYLDDLRSHALQYCEPVSGKMPQSRLTCFHAHVRDDKNADSFCFGSGASWDPAAKKFRLDCPVIHKLDANETAHGIVPFDSITLAWFDTGPRRVFSGFVSLAPGEPVVVPAENKPAAHGLDKPPDKEAFVILVKREGNNNLWHSLMEIWSMMNSVDVLRIARRGGGDDGIPFFQAPDDLDNTHVVMLDDYAEESTFDLWRFFGPRNPIVKLHEMISDPLKVPLPLQQPGRNVNIIVPLPGGSNPLWQNDWVVRDCRNVPLLKLLVRRVFEHYQVPRAVGPRPTAANDNTNAKDIVVTFIDRRGSRRLLNQGPLFEKLQERYPNVLIEQLDFATLSLRDQLSIVQDTDVLVGVHGAGLTHTMFMREGAGAVVEIQPENLGHKGFRNLAAMMGVKYFSAQAEMVLPGEVEDEETGKATDKGGSGTSAIRRRADADKPWQSSHVRMEEDRFLALMDVAIKSLYNEGTRNHQIV